MWGHGFNSQYHHPPQKKRKEKENKKYLGKLQSIIKLIGHENTIMWLDNLREYFQEHSRNLDEPIFMLTISRLIANYSYPNQWKFNDLS